MSLAMIVDADVKPIVEALIRLDRVGGDLRRPLGQIGLHVRRSAQRRLRGRRSDWGQSRGMLSKTLAVQVSARSVRVGSPLVYAAVQQLGTASLPGGAIRPKPPRKYLAIPVSRTLRVRGVWPRDLSPNEIKFVRAANIVIGRRRWKGPALVDPKSGAVMFALVRQVRIKGRPYLLFDSAEHMFALSVIAKAYRRALARSIAESN